MPSNRFRDAVMAAGALLVCTSGLAIRSSSTDGEAAPAARAGRSPAEIAAAILRPSIQVHGRGGSGGGGTIVYSHGGATYALTAFHVVAKAVEKNAARHPVGVTLYRADGTAEERIEADLALWHEKKDIALLRLRTGRDLPTAKVLPRAAHASVGVFTPVYAVGCPLGHDPLPSTGEISTLRKDVQGERFWMMNAPTIYGNSGGGVFHRETLELLGVSTMICTFDNPSATPVPHLGIVLPVESIAAWLTAAGRAFIVDPAAPRAHREW
jgi:S1-C subfamily serine protease